MEQEISTTLSHLIEEGLAIIKCLRYYRSIHAVTRENTHFGMPLVMDVGWGNGYCILPKDHPYYDKPYDDIPVNIHGGLTFASSTEELTSWGDLPVDGWMIGFDTCHSGDNNRRWTPETVLAEAEYLKEQLVWIDYLGTYVKHP